MGKSGMSATSRRSSPSSPKWHAEVLGTTRLRQVNSRESIRLSPSHRRLLAMLASRPGRFVPVDILVDAIWMSRPPASARASLHNLVSRIRERCGSSIIESNNLGYRLSASTDIDQFEKNVRRAIELAAKDAAASVRLLNRSLEMWHGAPYRDIEHVPEVAARAGSLHETRRSAEVARVRALIELGEHEESVTEAERLVTEIPSDETRWVLLVDALSRAGRRGDALSAVARATRHLRDYLGITPGSSLQDLHRALVEDPINSVSHIQLAPRGRETILTRLITLVDSGSSVVILGEDGIGKSTVMRELSRVLRRRGVRSVMVSAVENDASATAILDDFMTELGLPPLVGHDVIDTFSRRLNLEALESPIVLLVDDVGFAGPSTVAALDRCRRESNVRIVVTMGLREAVPTQLSDLRTEILEPLSDDAMRRVVGEVELMNGPAVGAQCAMLIEMAGGNPLLLAHLIAEVAGREVESQESIAKARTAAEGLAATVTRMLSSQHPSVRRAIDTAAVIGRRGSLRVLEELTSVSTVAATIASGLILQHGEEFVFRHGAVARVRSAAITEGFRVDVKRSFSDLSRRRRLPILTYADHSYDAALLNPVAAFGDCMAAGDEVAHRGLHQDAIRWFDAARDVAGRFLAGEPERALRARIRAGDARRLIGDPAHVVELLSCVEEALQLGNKQLIADASYAMLQFGGTSQSGHAQRQALHFARRAMHELRDSELWALIASATTLTLSLFDDPKRPRKNFIEALQIAKSNSLRMRILPYAYMTFGHPRDLERRIAAANELERLAQTAQDPAALFSAHHQHWANALLHGDTDALARHYGAMELLNERISTVGSRWEVLSSHAAMLIARGELQFAEDVAREAHGLLAPIMAERASAVLMSQLFAIRRAENRLGELSDVFGELVERQPSVGALRALFAATLVSTDTRRAHEEAMRATRMMHDDFTWLPAQFIVGEVLVNSGRTQGAEGVLTSLEPWEHLHAAPLTCSFGPVREVVQRLQAMTSMIHR